MAEITYNEAELKQRNIGRPVYQSGGHGWDIKTITYRELGVLQQLSKIRCSLKVHFTDWKAWTDEEAASKMAVTMMDTYLIKKSRGEDIPLPQPLVQANSVQAKAVGTPVNSSSEPVKDLLDISQFGEAANAGSDPIRDMTWVYNNLQIQNPDPKTAPSMGAYAHLKHLQENPDSKKDFLKSVYPRLIPPKSQLDSGNKFNDDNRTIFDLLDRLQAESADSQAKVPVLPVGLPEHQGV
jgi:hypothetical protein